MNQNHIVLAIILWLLMANVVFTITGLLHLDGRLDKIEKLIRGKDEEQ